MTIERLEYDFKSKLNELDSNKYRGMLIPEIDWKLNEAQDLLIQRLAQPRQGLGFESNQRVIDDLRPLVVPNYTSVPVLVETGVYSTPLPTDYRFFVSAYVKVQKGKCSDRKMRAYPVQHDDVHEEHHFSKANFEWEESNIRFDKDGIKIFADGNVNRFYLNYIRRPKYMHNAAGFGDYKLPDGTQLTGKQDPELPHLWREIVDLAVLITTGDLRIPDYQIKLNKFALSNE